MRFMTISFVFFFSTILCYGQDSTVRIDTVQQSQLLIPIYENSSSRENPYSRGIGQRIAGGVLSGLGGVNLLVGILVDMSDIYVDAYRDLDMEDMGNVIEKCIWIEGAVMASVGLPLLISGIVKNSQWEQWENEHNKISFKPEVNGFSFVVTF